MKTYKGEIRLAEKYYINGVEGEAYKPEIYGPNLGYILTCRFLDHPEFAGERGQTSLVVSYNEETGEVETLNSRYTVMK